MAWSTHYLKLSSIKFVVRVIVYGVCTVLFHHISKACLDFLTLVFEDQLTLERMVQKAFGKVFKAEKVFLHEKSRSN